MRSSTAAIALALAACSAAAPQGVVYVTSVIDKTTTWCPAGATPGAVAPSGSASISGSAGIIGGQTGTTLASSWAANQTPGASATASPSAYTGGVDKPVANLMAGFIGLAGVLFL